MQRRAQTAHIHKACLCHRMRAGPLAWKYSHTWASLSPAARNSCRQPDTSSGTAVGNSSTRTKAVSIARFTLACTAKWHSS